MEPKGWRKAVKLCENLKPDIILIDIRMDEMNGFEVIKIIKEKNNNLMGVSLYSYAHYNSFHSNLMAPEKMLRSFPVWSLKF